MGAFTFGASSARARWWWRSDAGVVRREHFSVDTGALGLGVMINSNC
jgi:hypothetical protein